MDWRIGGIHIYGTLKIPDIDSVRHEVWDSRRNSETLSMNAKKQPKRTMRADTDAT